MIIIALLQVTLVFSPQGRLDRPRDVWEWSVWVKGRETRTITAADVYMKGQPIGPLTVEAVKRKDQEQRRRSPARAALIGIEVISWGVATSQGFERLRFKGSWTPVTISAASGMRLVNALIERERTGPWEPPGNTLPLTIPISPGGSAQYTLYGTRGGDPFTMEVP